MSNSHSFQNRLIKIKKLSKEDILKNYSPAILSYIDNMEFDYEITVISVLLNLKLKGIIKENKNGILSIEDYSNVELDNIEKIILDNVQNGKVIVEKDRRVKNIY